MAIGPGDRLGPYEVETLLGTGGMGEVYRGHDARLGRAVALKVIAQKLVGDADGRRRFETEARAASALNHPAIVTIYDIGDKDGTSWIAMELIEGRTLREAVRDGPLPIRHAWSIARQLADGLAAAHAKHIVHRDLKPENVMVTGDGRVKILDFGLARQRAQVFDDAATVTGVQGAGTAAGIILGTVGYMSPEQASGLSADYRSDQFSFGAVIYELLTSRRAFARPTAVETMSAIIRDEPPPLGSLRGGVSDTFQHVISRCLEKQPEHRYASTGELAAALDSLTPESSAAAVAPDSANAVAAGPIRTSVDRRRMWLGAAAMAVAAIAIGLTWNREQPAAPAAIESIAVLPFENTAQDPDVEYIGSGVTDGLIDHLSRVGSLKVMARATVMRLKQRDPQQAARALGVGAIVTGAVSRRGGQVVIAAELIDGSTGERLWGQSFDRPIADLMTVQDSIASSIAQGLRLRLTGEERARLGGFGTSDPAAYELFLKGRFLMQQDTEDDELAARELFKQAIAKDPNYVDAHLALASSYERGAGSGYEPPDEAMARSREALAKAAAIDPSNISVRTSAAFQRFRTTRDWVTTERTYRELMHDPAVVRTVQYHPMALFFVAIGRPDEAVALAERALAVDPGNLESRAMLGNFLLEAGRLDDAAKVFESFAAEVPEDDRPRFGLADVYKRRGLFAQAAEMRAKGHELAGQEEAARLFTRVTTEAAYTAAELAANRLELGNLEMLATQRYIQPFDIARLHAQVGNREQALAILEKVEAGGYIGLMMLKVDDAWDSVRTDPRFAAIVRKIGIP